MHVDKCICSTFNSYLGIMRHEPNFCANTMNVLSSHTYFLFTISKCFWSNSVFKTSFSLLLIWWFVYCYQNDIEFGSLFLCQSRNWMPIAQILRWDIAYLDSVELNLNASWRTYISESFKISVESEQFNSNRKLKKKL